MTFNPIPTTINPYLFDGEPQRIHTSLPTKEQIAHYIENEGLNDGSFFEALKNKHYNKDIARELINVCIKNINDKSPEIGTQAISWLCRFLDVVTKDQKAFADEFKLLLDACEKEFIKRVSEKDLSGLSVPVLFLVRRFRSNVFHSLMQDKSHGTEIDRLITQTVGRTLRDLKQFCIVACKKVRSENDNLRPTANYLKLLGNPDIRKRSFQYREPDEEKYSSDFITNNRKKIEEEYEEIVREWKKTRNKSIFFVHNNFIKLGGLSGINIRRDIKHLSANKALLAKYVKEAMSCLQGDIPDDAPKTAIQMQIDAARGLRELLTQIRRDPQSFSELYDKFLFNCDDNYRSNFRHLFVSYDLEFQLDNNTEEEHHQNLMRHNHVLEPVPIGLWYCLRTEFGRYGGVNTTFHQHLKDSIINQGLGKAFLTEGGDFLEKYDAKALIKALDVHIDKLLQEEESERRIMDYYDLGNGLPGQQEEIETSEEKKQDE